MKTKNKFIPFSILFGILSLVFSAIAIPIALDKSLSIQKSNDFSKEDYTISDVNLDANQFALDIKPLVPIEFNTYMPLISTKLGPIGFLKNEIRALDWFGALRWSLDTTNLAPPDHTFWINRAFVNWAYSFSDDILWILTNAKTNFSQKIVSIDGKTGLIIDQIDLNNRLPNNFALLYFIQVLTNGNIIVYGPGGSWDKRMTIYDVQTRSVKIVTSTISDAFLNTMLGVGDKRLFNLIPITTNRNILVLQTFGDKSKFETSFALVDDQFNLIYNNIDNNVKWSKTVHIANGADNWQNFPDKTFYTLLDGRVVGFIFNKLLIFDNDKILNGQDFLTIYDIPNSVQSFSFDTNENMFLTYRNESIIYKLTLPAKNSNASYIVSTYYDLASSPIAGIRDNATKFVLYNVSGYSGQIMLIKPVQRFSPRDDTSIPSEEEIKKNLYGLSAAIVSNTYIPTDGDSKGLLNTADAFQFSADFEINQNILNSKLPSEIVSTDLTLLHDAKFTTNALYSSFTKKDINDETKKLTIEVYLDQVPWFADDLPLGFIPLKVTKVFDTLNNISSRVSWKNVNSDYDFRNTLPTKIDQIDLKRFDPFLINLSSQRITNNITQEQIFPKKEYKAITPDDNRGTINIECIYTYMPLGVATRVENAKTFSTSQSFNIFKNSDPRSFEWLLNGVSGSDYNNIKLIPNLKFLSESKLLPSSVNGNDSTLFQSVVNTNISAGYPLSKMNFTLIANDVRGELKITAVLPASYNGISETFSQTYIGFNKLNDYFFEYKKPSYLAQVSGSGNAVNNINPSYLYNTMLPSEITEEMIYLDFVNFTGFNDLDLSLNLVPNNITGELEILFKLNKDYPEILANNRNTFSLNNDEYVSSLKLSGFLNQNSFNEQYTLTFKNNNDQSLNTIKNLEINVILNSINSSAGLTIDGINYKSLEELVLLFFSFRGSKIPTIKPSNLSIYSNNGAGSLTFELLFLPSETGLTYNLIFSSIFSGFIKGVEKPTNDSFIFKNQNNLDISLLNKLPSQIKAELLANKLLVQNYFVNFVTGQFTNLLLDNNAFILIIDANDVYGSLSISISFDKTLIINPLTLTTYSIEYIGFQKVN